MGKQKKEEKGGKKGEDEKGWKEFVQEERGEEERRERGREKEKGESGARGALPSADKFPSTKLGNNITPMKGGLGKTTTPTSRSPTELNQNLQNNPQQRRPDSTLHPEPTSVTHQKYQSINSTAREPPFIRRPKLSEIRANVSNSP